MPRWMLVAFAPLAGAFALFVASPADSQDAPVPETIEVREIDDTLRRATADVLEQRAQTLAMDRKYAEARRHAFELFTREPEGAMANLLMAYALRGEGKHETAIVHSTVAALASEPHAWHRIDALVSRAASYIDLKRPAAAARDLDRAEALANESARRQPSVPLPQYQLACISSIRAWMHAESGENEKANAARELAVAYLVIARKHGYDRWDHARADLDLLPLHGFMPFDKMVR